MLSARMLLTWAPHRERGDSPINRAYPFIHGLTVKQEEASIMAKHAEVEVQVILVQSAYLMLRSQYFRKKLACGV